jgi:hypothetical protein
MPLPRNPHSNPDSPASAPPAVGTFASLEEFSTWIDGSLARMEETLRRFRTPHSELAALISEAVSRR